MKAFFVSCPSSNVATINPESKYSTRSFDSLSKTFWSLSSWTAIDLIDLFFAVAACLDYSDMGNVDLFNII
jgi:hypothetical protein